MNSTDLFDRAPDRRFPDDFRFGAATAAHQVEGGNDGSDWWDFEREPGRIKDGSRSGAACEHYSRFREDIGLLRELSLTTYRFSVEWARVEPEPGRIDGAALAHYVEMVDACLAAGVEPCVTLYHFTLPRWFAARGGWLSSDAPGAFGRFARAVAEAFAGRVSLWVTLNEPIVYLYHGLLAGIWPPGARSPRAMILAGRNLIRAHFEARREIHRVSDRAPAARGPSITGLASNLRVFDPAREGNLLDRGAAAVQEAIYNWAFLDSVHLGRLIPPFGLREAVSSGPWPGQDFLGVNYYTRGRVRFDITSPTELFGAQETSPGAPVSDLGWEIYPEGIRRVVRKAYERYGLPVYITENGIADAADRMRAGFLVRHLDQILRMIEEGTPIKGYYHWSIIDNFEWAEGFTPRFGLYAVDYATQERSLRPSGALYGRIAAARSLPSELVARHPIPSR
jgi:beta-glucosidase